MGIVVSRAAVLLDQSFAVALPSTAACDFIADPYNWLHIIPGCAAGLVTVEDNGNFAVIARLESPKKWGFHFYNINKGSTTLSYDVSIGYDVQRPAAVFHVDYDCTDLDGNSATALSCVRRACTKFVQLRNMHIPYRPFVRSGMRKENIAMVQLMAAAAGSTNAKVV